MFVAVVANAVIFLAKAVGGLVSGSVALMAEAAHSLADTINQVFLFVSINLAARHADDEHQFGYGRERFFWALLAAIFIFVGGAVFSAVQGIWALLSPGEETSFIVAYVVLAISLASECVSFLRAVRQLRREAARSGDTAITAVRQSTDPTLTTVLLEDSAAIIGSVVALAAVGLHQATGRAEWDAAGALVISGLLILVAVVLGRNAKSLLLGQAARPDEREALRQVLLRRVEIDEVLELLTSHIGPNELVVSARVRINAGVSTRDVAMLADTIDDEMREAVPDVAQVFLDPTARTREQDNGDR